jgi:hypothetical protein
MKKPAKSFPTESARHKRPLHEKVRVLGWLRGKLRGALFGSLRKIASTDDARHIQTTSLSNLLPRRPHLRWEQGEDHSTPYADLGKAPSRPAVERDDPIFITARFRSGSTLLWNLFRNVPGCTSYYEPLNERRWFDPSARGSHTDPTHRGVEDYWREYEGLTELNRFFRLDWNERNLFMDADSWDPALKGYVEMLIDRAPGRPVLQFNRIDFRLPWFRAQFPRAKILHLYRHPRDQWCSSLVNPTDVPRDVTLANFPPYDHYYLTNWVRDLKYHFPFLDDSSAHPYRAFYFIWKLSYLFGKRYADYSLAFEDLCGDPDAHLPELLRAADAAADVEGLKKLIDRPKGGRWKAYADAEWFEAHESACEAVLSDYLGEQAGMQVQRA